MNKKVPKSIDDYVDRFPKETQQLLRKMRLTIRKAAPKAKESISYGMPTLSWGGIGFILRHTRIISGSIQVGRSRRLRRIYPRTSQPRVGYNSRSTNRFQRLW